MHRIDHHRHAMPADLVPLGGGTGCDCIRLVAGFLRDGLRHSKWSQQPVAQATVPRAIGRARFRSRSVPSGANELFKPPKSGQQIANQDVHDCLLVDGGIRPLHHPG